MKNNYFRYCLPFLAIFFSLNSTWAQDQLVVKPVHPVNNPLIDSLVGGLVGVGVKVTNIRSNLKQTSKAIGTFKAPPQLMGIAGGLIMTTGNADTMAGDNSTGPNIISVQIPPGDTLTGGLSLPIGRQLLNKTLESNGATTRTTNCVTIQFDVVPSSDSIKFNYVFASEEYNTFVCSNFNDIFGFFIKGPGIEGDQNLLPTFEDYKNIAIIPGTDLPVTINTVNNGDDADPEGLCNFTPEGIAAYIDNVDDAAPTFDSYIHERLEFGGLTRKLTAEAKVVPCQTYTLTLTISDVSDGAYDSGVFIEKGSLRSGLKTTASSEYSARFPYSIINCNPGKFIVDRSTTNTTERSVVRYSIEGTAVNGVDYMQVLPNGTQQPLVDSLVLEPGVATDTIVIVGIDGENWTASEQKTVWLKFLSSLVPYFNGQPNYCGDSVKMTIRKRFLYNAGIDKRLCQFEDTLLFPISSVISSDYYIWREVANGDTIPTTDLTCTDCPTPRAFNTVPKTFVVYVVDSISQCVTNDTIHVDILLNPTLSMTSDKPGNGVCENQFINLFANPPSADPTWTYQWAMVDSAANVLIGQPSSLTTRTIRLNIGATEAFHVTATNSLGCSETDSIVVNLLKVPDFSLPLTDTVCYKERYLIKASNVKDSLLVKYSWEEVLENNLIRKIDSNQTYLTAPSIRSGLYILTGENGCLGDDGFAKDTFNLVVMDSISAAHTYTLVNDNFTVAPVQFNSSFQPSSYARLWTLTNLDMPWDTTLQGTSALVNLSRGGNYLSTSVVYNQMGTYLCSDTVSQTFYIEPLGNVFIPDLMTDNSDNFNDFFKITARDENGKLLREITNGDLTVYNRWGKKVYERENYDNTLNAAALKEGLTDGVYFFEYKNERYKYKNGGWFRIIHE